MRKTFQQMKDEVANLLDNYHQNIKAAYANHGNELAIAIKLKLWSSDGVIELQPSIEFLPMPKTKSETYKVRIDENQLEMWPPA